MSGSVASNNLEDGIDEACLLSVFPFSIDRLLLDLQQVSGGEALHLFRLHHEGTTPMPHACMQAMLHLLQDS